MHNYSNDKITVHFDLEKCIHSAVCLKCLPAVFDTSKRPWVNVDAASVEEIVHAVDSCPSRALTYTLQGEISLPNSNSNTEITVLDSGPYVISGGVRITLSNGREFVKSGTCALCRCGKTKDLPFCDGSHQE